MNLFKCKLLQTSLLSGVAAMSFAAPAAFAQDAAKPADDTASVEELVVTGSRIRKNEFTSDAPLKVITAETSTLEGLVDTAEILQQAPIASGSFQVNGLMGSFVTTGGPGAQTISLRGLGPNRTLVLLDGRRIGPAGVRGTVGPVDLNVLPGVIMERTEIYKDGASPIYGSDAIAGVVNMITKKRYDGAEISIYGSLPQRGEGAEYAIDGIWGKTFERGRIMVAGEYYAQEELRRGDRKYTACTAERVYDPDTLELVDHIDPLTGKAKCFNVFTGVAQTTTTYGGVFQYAVPGITYPSAAQGNNIAATFPTLAAQGFVRAGRAFQLATQPYMNYDSPLYARASAIYPYELYTAYASGSYDVTPNVELYGDLLINRRESRQHGFQQMFPTVSRTNPNNPFIDIGNIRYDAIPVIAFKRDQHQEVDYVRGVAGFRGKFGEAPLIGGWDWDVYGEYSHSSADYTTDYIHQDRIDAVTGPGVACNPALITFSGPVGCLSIPWFSQRVLAGQFTPEESAFLFGKSKGNTKYTQAMIEASIPRDHFTTQAGAISGAFGVHLRHEKIDDTPSDAESEGNLYNLTSATPTRGHDTVKEVFGELSIPLLKDWDPLGSFEMSVAGRYTDYNSYGSNETWKVGFNWTPTEWLRFRATKGTSYRAPALYELFIGDQTSFQSQNNVDPCIRWENSSNERLRTNCASLGIAGDYAGGGSGLTIITGGGAGVLKAETSKSSNIGVILTPKFESFDVSLAVDYFEIKVNNEVAQFGAASIVRQCLVSPDFPTDPLCSLYTRDPNTANHPIVTVNDSYVNVAKEINRGIDVNLHFRKEFGFGTLTIDNEMIWQLEALTQLLGESTPQDFNGSTVEPDFTAEVHLRFDKGDWTVFWDVDIISKASDTDLDSFNFTDVHPSNTHAQGGPVDLYFKQFTEAMAYHDVSLRKKFDTWTIWGGVKNIFDEAPPALSDNESFRYGYAALNAYDLIGRQFWLRIDKRF